jgi:hypothetical protein
VKFLSLFGDGLAGICSLRNQNARYRRLTWISPASESVVNFKTIAVMRLKPAVHAKAKLCNWLVEQLFPSRIVFLQPKPSG